MAIPVPTIDAAGMSVPTYAEILASVQTEFRTIYGADVVISADSQDGQLLAIIASAVFDAYQFGLATFQAFAPAYAQGVGLSSLVKLNGLTRRVATKSTVEVTITGVTGTVITNGVIRDLNDVKWDLPASVTIPLAGEISVTATAQEAGATEALPGTVTIIATPTRGWQSVTNAASAVVGQPVETDAALRRRRASAVATPASALVAAIQAAILGVNGVEQAVVFENDTNVTDANGIPGHSVYAVVLGGLKQDIIDAIGLRKTPGTGTHGSESGIYIDSRGMGSTIKYDPVVEAPMTVEVTIKALDGYVSSTADLIADVVAAHFNAFAIGEDSYLARLYSAVNLTGDVAVAASGRTRAELAELSSTYYVTVLKQARDADPPAAADVTIALDEVATGLADDVTVTVAP